MTNPESRWQHPAYGHRQEDDHPPLDPMVVVDPTLALIVLAVVAIVGFVLGCITMWSVS